MVKEIIDGAPPFSFSPGGKHYAEIAREALTDEAPVDFRDWKYQLKMEGQKQVKKANREQVPMHERPARYGWPTTNDRGYTINERPSGPIRPMKVICVGAGASGISLAKSARDLKNVDLIIYEKNAEVAGTWLENRYPGCACDIPSVTYQYSWEPAIWSKFYSEAPEIFRYFKGVADKYQLYNAIRLQHRVDHAQWIASEAKWKVQITDLTTNKKIEDSCDVFVNAMGFLNDWNWPNISGLDTFRGVVAHSAGYPEDLSLRGKRVAVVGNGSSGIQLVANIHQEASHLYTWIRSPTWITPGFAQKYAGPNGGNFAYTEKQKQLLRDDPEYYLKYRKAVELEMNGDFLAFHLNTPQSNGGMRYAAREMRKRLQDREDLVDSLIPKEFPLGCRRPTPGTGYLEALLQPNVTTFKHGGLTQVTPDGFIDPEGNEHKVDVIILATGFNTSWVPRFPIIANGINLQDIYRKTPVSYLGVAAPQMPNYLTFYGPYGPLGQGSAMPMIEAFTTYIISVIKKMQTDDIRDLTPKQRCIDDYAEHADLFNKRMVYSGHCRSWFKGNQIDGRVMLHPGSRAQYLELMSSPRYEDFDINYWSRNMWAWLGNGYSLRDLDDSDKSWYLGLVDGVDVQKTFDVDEMLCPTKQSSTARL
ncbi:putative sterigmatocystin biosynthesis monooxygenase stcW [Fonsecaea pedrosoi]|nr:putative sterigmatocystin biosynthesis monooxygenase stcW [Fonsecaea pedrosoi]